MMGPKNSSRRQGGCMQFLGDFRALFIKAFLLAIRKPGQIITEIFLAYAFMGLLLGLRYILDRRYYPQFRLPQGRPEDYLNTNGTGDTIYYYPSNPCATTIVNTAVSDIRVRWPTFTNNIQVVSDPTLASASNATLQSIFAYIYFTNIDSCTTPASMPDEVQYTLRFQENGPYYYHAQSVKLSENDYLWKRSPEEFCQSNSTIANYTNRFIGIQNAVDMSIIKYTTNSVQNLTSNIYMNHFGCPEFHLDQLQSSYAFFIPIFFSIIFVVTFILTVGYIVEERRNKTKEYLRIYGLRTWINNLVWVTRSMIIYIFLIGLVTGLSMLVMPSSNAKANSISKALFNYTHWTLIWTVLFVYAIQVSCFSVFFGQFFKESLLAKLIGFVIWVITFIDFYPGVPVGVRYFLCLFPNTGLLFCIQVILQYERKGAGLTTFNNLYSNLFPYPLYIGWCLLLMLVYSVIYLFLAIYVERVNPGEFGVSQSWNYLFKKSYWRPQSTAVIRPTNDDHPEEETTTANRWIQTDSEVGRTDQPSVVISHLTKKFGKFHAVSDLSLNFYKGEVCSLLGHNGAGKTTTTFILVGMLEPSSGHVSVEGLDLGTHIQDVRKILGFCPQYDILYDDLSVEEHLTLIGRMRHLDPKTLAESNEHILNIIGLVKDRQTLSKNLSGGMKRRLSIGISLIGDPTVLILDEPTSGIDPYNRRLIWTIIRKMKDAGKCIILTTHFLEEADVLSDRIAIMSSGRLQANGTPDFLKSQIEFEYRVFVDKRETCDNDGVLALVREHVPDVVVERQSASEMVLGVRRNQSKEIGQLIRALDAQSEQIGVDSYGLSMTSIEEVFLKLIQEEEEKDGKMADRVKARQELANRVFRVEHARESGMRCFWLRIVALLIKRWHVARRQLVFILGFFLFPLIVEILIVSVIPTPKVIQASLGQNAHVAGAQVTLVPSIYNPQTIVVYAENDGNNAQTRLLDYVQGTGGTVVQLSNDTVLSYVLDRYLANEDTFVNTYQMGFAIYPVVTSVSSALYINNYFSTVNYHTIPTSLSACATNMFQFYANSSAKKITTTNEPIITTSTAFTTIARLLDEIYCFDTLPTTLFNFLNSILASIFIGVLILPIIQERINQSKDLQLLTNVSKGTYWFSNVIFDYSACILICVLLTIVIKIGSAANPNADAEVHIFQGNPQMGYFLLMILMYSVASLPLLYVFAFAPSSELVGFILFFIINLVACFLDMVCDFISVFSQFANVGGTGLTGLSGAMLNLRWVVVGLFPAVNFKHSLFNIRIRSDETCLSTINGLMFTNYTASGPWMAVADPGLGLHFIIFCVQAVFWWIILVLIENQGTINLGCRRCCKCDKDLEQLPNNDPSQLTIVEVTSSSTHWHDINDSISATSALWDDSHLDEDVRNERRLVLQDNSSASSAVIVVRDLVQRFKKPKNKARGDGIFTAVDHLNFHIAKQSCFGLLGANGAGKTTTFRMLINDLRPTTGEIIINGRDINKSKRDMEIGFCPQFDWLVPNLSVKETLTLFARLKGLKWSIIDQLTSDMIDLFGLEAYKRRSIHKLSGGNKRKTSATLAFMANPSLVFLDEPTTGLDAAAKRKLWEVIRAARDTGLTIVMTSHSMEECEALCTKIGIMKLGQFVCLGNLQRLKNRFGNGYAVQVKLPVNDVETFKQEMSANVPGVVVQEEHNGMLYCNVPYSPSNSSERIRSGRAMNLAHIFEWFSKKNEEKVFESYSITQTTLEQIFVRVAGEDQETNPDETKKTA